MHEKPARRHICLVSVMLMTAVLMLLSDHLRSAHAELPDFSQPWLRLDRAVVIDAYEYNPIDWKLLNRDKRIVGFINKASDGLPPPYRCSVNDTEYRLCRALWRRYAVARELFHTRRTIAKSLGLKWGAYHLGRPGNPIKQAEHFLSFADPAPDDLIAIDIEEDDPEKWISLKDAEIFARHIHRRLGRYPVLYTNGTTSRIIAERRSELPLLSRLTLWYARYKPEIGDHFPKGNWDGYTLWQFSSQANCDRRVCPYRVAGTPLDIDINIATMPVRELRDAWPLGELVGEGALMLASVPLPVTREIGMEGKSTLEFVPVRQPTQATSLANEYRRAFVPADEDLDPTGDVVAMAKIYRDAQYQRYPRQYVVRPERPTAKRADISLATLQEAYEKLHDGRTYSTLTAFAESRKSTELNKSASSAAIRELTVQPGGKQQANPEASRDGDVLKPDTTTKIVVLLERSLPRLDSILGTPPTFGRESMRADNTAYGSAPMPDLPAEGGQADAEETSAAKLDGSLNAATPDIFELDNKLPLELMHKEFFIMLSEKLGCREEPGNLLLEPSSVCRASSPVQDLPMKLIAGSNACPVVTPVCSARVDQ